MAISIMGLTQDYTTRQGQTIRAIDGIDLEIRDNEFLAIVGPSGCGKTTLLRILCGLVQQSAGLVSQDGQKFSGQRTDIGVVFQESRLLPWLTILDNVLLPLRVQHRPVAPFRERARSLLTRAGLADFATRYPSELSGGMQQRAAICRALIHEPTLLLMDEPFGALDAMTRETMNQELLNIWGAAPKTVVSITHSIQEAVFLADRVAVFSRRPGRIVALVDINLPRQRSLSMMLEPRFIELTGQLRSYFNAMSAFH